MNYIVLDLGYGDGGKGTVTDWLSRRTPGCTNVRFNGGGQAAHNVVTPEGKHHTFAQFGSGTLAGARTHLSSYMLVNPSNLMVEMHALTTRHEQWDILDRLTIDPRALVVTRLHMAYNRLTELLRGKGRHGSCGQGIGATVEYSINHPIDALRCIDLANVDTTIDKIRRLQAHFVTAEIIDRVAAIKPDHMHYERIIEEFECLMNLDPHKTAIDYHYWAQLIDWRYDHDLTGDLIFEGAQGVLLDEKWGSMPYVTWSNCTDGNARTILAELDAEATCIGVTRTYATRHGAGPFDTEDPTLVDALPEIHNGTGVYQGVWRCGWLNLSALRYSIERCQQVDAIAVTHMDRAPATRKGLRVAHDGKYGPEYSRLSHPYNQSIAAALDRPLYVSSYGPSADSKRENLTRSAL